MPLLRSRYYYLLLYLNLIVSLIEFTSSLIYSERYQSSLSSLVVALLFTGVAAYVFESRMKRFPGESITRIMNGVFPNGLQNVLLFSNLLLSYWVGLIFLDTFTQIAHRCISPDLPTGLLFGVFLLLVVCAAILDSKSILFMMEVVVLFQVPFSLILLLIFGFDPNVNFDFMVEAVTYIRNLPSYHMIAAGAFLFNGYTHLLVFNEHLVLSNRKIRHVFVWAVGAVLLFAFYFIPIGYLGLAGFGSDNDVWFTTANSMKIQYFFIERYVLLLLMVQLGISLMFVIVCWHSSLQFLRLVKRTDGGNRKWVSISLLLFVSCIFRVFVDESAIRNSFSWFLNIKFAFDLTMIGVVVWCAKAKQRKTA